MLTEVTFAKAKHGRESLIAYKNDKNQRIFIDVKLIRKEVIYINFLF